MSTVIPSEFIHAIVSTTIARYVDDLILEPSSLTTTETEPADQVRFEAT